MRHMGGLTITRVTHACVVMDFDGHAILTDPWWVERSVYHHGEPVGMSVADLPRLTGVTVTHKYHTHYDMRGFGAYPDREVPIVVPRGKGARARKAGFTEVIELDPWDTAWLGPVRVTAAPGEHITVENTYIYQAGGWTAYHSGDTVVIPSLVGVAQRFPHIDVAFMSVTAQVIGLGINRQLSMTPDEAAELCALLKPRVVVPIAPDSGAIPIVDRFLLKRPGTADAFSRALAERGLATEVKVLAPGEPYPVPASVDAVSQAGG